MNKYFQLPRNSEERVKDFSKRPSKVKRVVGNTAGSEFDCSDHEKSKCVPKAGKAISELTKVLSTVTEQLVAPKEEIQG